MPKQHIFVRFMKKVENYIAIKIYFTLYLDYETVKN
ncbi:hypothetical protein SAMN05421820_102733 [Pedobacter steynii]|uniref:Uncharacterized protein n=1 Tax=Pedobacter steynii TaxID=430522 RepID=A0A1G9PRF6_9SPHI|nr:hypothetical protein SAMN05421820_102733 [Pedobacter steynii]